MGKDVFLDAVCRKNKTDNLVCGTPTSIVCKELMEKASVYFSDAHTDPEKMFKLALTGHSILGFDNVMPLFSVCHEAAAVGCKVDWGSSDMMPKSGKPVFTDVNDIMIPDDFLSHPGCSVPLKAISLLQKESGNDFAVCGKVLGPWTQAYHYFGLENFLMMSVVEPDKTKNILNKLLPVTLAFAKAQIEAGVDCILIADHATSDLCSPQAYKTFLKPVHTICANEINCPTILHICGNTKDRIEYISQTGLNCFHWDTKSGTSRQIRELAGDNLSLMGGISNYTLLRGCPEEVEKKVSEAFSVGIDVIGPECAIPLTTPLENLLAISSAMKNS